MTTYRHFALPLTLLAAAGALGAVALHARQQRLDRVRALPADRLAAWEDEGGNVEGMPPAPPAPISDRSITP
jgi:hypothetical protein